MITKPIGLYVHIPFCIRKCNYCDFCSFPMSSVDWKDSYIDALTREILAYKGKEICVDSIFFGGGTPSLLSTDDFRKIVSVINESFIIKSDCEFSVEVNPGTVTEEKIASFVENGVNRISIGLQSINENELKTLGRIHSFDDFLISYKIIRNAGINNVNVDLMYRIPEQSKSSFIQTLKTVAELSPEHISLYGLILEDGTPFYQHADQLNLPDEDAECDMYYLAAELMKNSGYSHYEISNYAKPEFECKHNLKYWRNEEYIGVGLSAYSHFEGKRFGNTKNPKEYLAQSGVKYDYLEVIDVKGRAYEYVMLALRLKEGFSLSEYEDRFNVDFRTGRMQTLSRLASAGLIRLDGDRISLTERGFYVSNLILTELL